MQNNIDAILSILGSKLLSVEDEYRIKYPKLDEIITDLISDILIEFDSIKPSDVNLVLNETLTDKLEKYINDNWDNVSNSLKVKL
jgi:hypothetical protein